MGCNCTNSDSMVPYVTPMVPMVAPLSRIYSCSFRMKVFISCWFQDGSSTNPPPETDLLLSDPRAVQNSKVLVPQVLKEHAHLFPMLVPAPSLGAGAPKPTLQPPIPLQPPTFPTVPPVSGSTSSAPQTGVAHALPVVGKLPTGSAATAAQPNPGGPAVSTAGPAMVQEGAGAVQASGGGGGAEEGTEQQRQANYRAVLEVIVSTAKRLSDATGLPLQRTVTPRMAQVLGQNGLWPPDVQRVSSGGTPAQVRDTRPRPARERIALQTLILQSLSLGADLLKILIIVMMLMIVFL